MENGKWTKQHPILHFKVFSQVNPISPFISTLRHILANAHSHSFNIHWMLSDLSAMKTMVQHLKSSEIKIRKKITNKSKGKTYHLCLFQNLSYFHEVIGAEIIVLATNTNFLLS